MVFSCNCVIGLQKSFSSFRRSRQQSSLAQAALVSGTCIGKQQATTRVSFNDDAEVYVYDEDAQVATDDAHEEPSVVLNDAGKMSIPSVAHVPALGAVCLANSTVSSTAEVSLDGGVEEVSVPSLGHVQNACEQAPANMDADVKMHACHEAAAIETGADVTAAAVEDSRELEVAACTQPQARTEELGQMYTATVAGYQQSRFEVFVIDVNGTAPHPALRRYHHFVELDGVMRRKFPNLPSLPPKSFFRKKFSRRFMEERQRSLAAYMEAVTRIDPSLSDVELRNFLGVADGVGLAKQIA